MDYPSYTHFIHDGKIWGVPTHRQCHIYPNYIFTPRFSFLQVTTIAVDRDLGVKIAKIPPLTVTRFARSCPPSPTGFILFPKLGFHDL